MDYMVDPQDGYICQETPSREALDEEIKWRRWVDKRFVQIITVNIYRTMWESWQTFDYITEHGNFNFAERQAARVAGSGQPFLEKTNDRWASLIGWHYYNKRMLVVRPYMLCLEMQIQ